MSLPILCIDRYAAYLLEDPSYPAGGAAVQLLSWLSGLLEEGAEVYLVCAKVPANIPEEFTGLKFLPVMNGDSSGSLSYIKGLYKKLNLPRSVIYQAGAGYLTYFVARIARRYGHFFLHRIANDADTDERLKLKLTAWKRFLYHRGAKETDLLLCQNTYQFNQCKNIYPGNKVDQLPNPFKNFYNVHEVVPFERRGYFGWAGIFQYQKNLPLFLEIVEANPEISFQVAGKLSGNADDDTKAAVKKLKEKENVIYRGFLGRVELLEFMQSAKALICTSRYEGFSNTFLEAFWVGTPVITSINANPDDIFNKYQIGYTAETVQEYTEAIDSTSDQDTFESLSENCRAYVKEYHDYRMLSKKLLAMIDKEF